MSSKIEAISRLRRQLTELAKVPGSRSDRSGAFDRWQRAARVAVDHTFGAASKHSQEFSRINYHPTIVTHNTTETDRQDSFDRGLKRAQSLLESFIEEIEEYWPSAVSAEDNRAELDYDVCLSFAVEDRQYVELVGAALRLNGIRSFYDLHEDVRLWGKDLSQHFDALYTRRARYCVLFISAAYAGKLWAKRDLRSAETRSFLEWGEYILPARFDDTELPGLGSTVAYIDLRPIKPEKAAELIGEIVRSNTRAVDLQRRSDVVLDSVATPHAQPTVWRQHSPSRRPSKLFYSYLSLDENLRLELEAHLATLQHDNVLEPWSCREITAGGRWDREIRRQLNDADIILLLISADFLNSPYIQSVELRRALERHRAGDAVVIPVILRPCDWKTQQFAELQALPHGGKPVTKTRPRDDAWVSIAVGIRKMLEQGSIREQSETRKVPLTNGRMVSDDLSPLDIVRERLRAEHQDMVIESNARPAGEVAAVAQIRNLAPSFTRSLAVRREVARDVERISSKLSLPSIFELVLSARSGERLAAGIAMRTYVSRHDDAASLKTVRRAASIGLRDPHARVRYRFVEAVMSHPMLMFQVKDLLRELAIQDTDEVVRETAAAAVAQMAAG